MRRTLVFHLFALLPLLTAGVSAQEAENEIPVQLPKYTVTGERDLPPPERWHYARIPGFEVLANGAEGEATDLLNHFQRFANAVQLVSPGLAPRGTAQATLIICGRGDQFGLFQPEAAHRTERATSTLTLRSREQAALVVDLQTKVLNLVTPESAAEAATAVVAVDESGATSGTAVDPGFETDPYRQLYREYLHFLFSASESRPPPWFAEGLAQLFMAMKVTKTSITLGELEDPNIKSEPVVTGLAAAQRDRDFNASLARRALLPLPEMFAVAADSTTALNPLGSTWVKQCYAFVHWGMYGDKGAHQKAFFTFVSRLDREPLSEALFTDCFRKNYGEMQQELRNYIEFTRHNIAGVQAEKGQKIPEPPPVTLREATEAEVGRLKGETLRLAGRNAAGHTALVTPYMRGERDPALLAALGLDEAAGGDLTKARKLLEAAAEAKVVRARTYVELARLRLAEARTHPEGAAGKCSARQVSLVLDPLFTARSQPPALPETYELIADTWAQSDTPPSAANLAVLDEGVRLFLRNSALIYASATLKAKSGLPAEAESLVRLGLRVTTDPGLRARFEALRAELPVAPAKN